MKWEYKITGRADLNREGLDGWELVAVEPFRPHPIAEFEVPAKYIFKRRLEGQR